MVVCFVCGKVFRRVTWCHLKLYGITITGYRNRYPDSPMFSEELLAELSAKLKGFS